MSERLISRTDAEKVFGLEGCDLDGVPKLALGDQELFSVVEICKAVLKKSDEERASYVINPKLLDEERAARSVSLSVGQLARLRRQGHIKPPAFTVIGSAGRGRKICLYDPELLATQLLQQTNGGDIDAWLQHKSRGRA